MADINWAELASTLFEEAGDALFLFDPDTEQIRDVNPMAQRLSGYSRPELLEMKISYLIRAANATDIQRLHMAFRRTGLFHSPKGFWLRQQFDKLWLPVDLTITRLHAKPKPLVLVTARDNSENREMQEKLRNAEAELRRVLASVSDCLWTADVQADGQLAFRDCSPVVETITGRSPEFFLAGIERWCNVVAPEDRPLVEQAFKRWCAGQSGQVEFRLPWLDSSIHWLRNRVVVTPGPEGRTFRLDGVLSDITRQKQAEVALRESLARQWLLLEQLPEILWTIDTDFRFTLSLGAGLARLNLRPNEVVGQTLFEYYQTTDEDFPPIAAHLQAIEGEAVTYESVWKGHTYHSHVEPLLNDEGDIIGAIGVALDVSDCRQADEDLRESEERYRVLFDRSLQGIIVHQDSIIRLANQTLAHIFGYDSHQELVGENLWRTLVDPAEWPELQAQTAALLRGENLPVHPGWQGLRKDGSRIWIQASATLVSWEGRPAVCAFFIDVTEQKRAEEMVRESQRALAGLMSNLPGIAYRCRNDPNWTMEYVSEGALALTGYAPAQLICNRAISFAQLIHPEDQDYVWQEVQTAVRKNHSYQLNFRIRTASREEKWVWLQGRGIASPEGPVVSLEGFITDITERKRAEENLRASEGMYRILLENLPQCVFLKDREGRFRVANKAFCTTLGCTEAEVLGKTDLDFFPRELAERFRADDRWVMTRRQPLEYEDPRQILGQARLVHVLKTPIEDMAGQVVGVLGIRWDVTDQRNLEAQLRQSQKMEAIGQLAGGIAHDFNNLLTGILGNVALAMGDIPNSHPCRVLLDNAEVAGLRASELTQQLLGFSRRTPLRLEPLDLNASIQETLRLLRHVIDPRIAVHAKPQANLWPVKADPAQIVQVLMNLCLNARDAMPQGGNLVLETTNVSMDYSNALDHLEGRPGDYVRLRVTDTGHGISAEVRQHIFEPFFTTKEPGKGTGLGLAMVFGIVQQHHGWIECHSVVDRGTTFDIYLPRLSAPTPAPPLAISRGTDGVRGGHETILLADDEEIVSRLGRVILERYGYRVLGAANGLEAKEIYRQRQKEIDLVILDMAMPKLSGLDTLRELRALNPSARVLVSSGYCSEEDLQAVKDEGAAGFITKPYRPADLARHVRTALDQMDKVSGTG